MGQSTDELTRNIELTRESLSQDVDELTDKVSPGRIAQRRKEAATSKLRSMREQVMGSAQESGEALASAGQHMSDNASDAVDTIEQKAKGNPLAAGAVAFGAGMILASLFPATRTEAHVSERAMDTAREHGQPMVDQATAAGRDVADHLKESAGQAADEVRASAQESADHVKQETQASAEHVKAQTPGT
jgi:ElaB/YqjD/DUF883 family membrane-anchored ribosome-binding protein